MWCYYFYREVKTLEICPGRAAELTEYVPAAEPKLLDAGLGAPLIFTLVYLTIFLSDSLLFLTVIGTFLFEFAF